jgi:hypothetical protein
MLYPLPWGIFTQNNYHIINMDKIIDVLAPLLQLFNLFYFIDML